MPRTVSDRKLPDRYCGEVTRQNSSQKYDWQQKMARLSLEAKEHKSGGSPTLASISTDKSVQEVLGVKPEAGSDALTEGTPNLRTVQPDYQQQPPPPNQVQDARRYYQHTPASDSTGGGPALAKEYQRSYGGEQEGALEPGKSAPISQPPLQNPQYSSGQHPSGRRDIGYTMAQSSTDPQHHQSNRQYDAARPAVRGGVTYDYIHGGAPQSHRYDEPPPPVMGSYAPPSSYRRSGDTEPDIFEGAASRRYTPPMSGTGSWGAEDHKVQDNRYRFDSRHTSESDSGWYGPLNNMQQQHPSYNPRRGGNSNYQPGDQQHPQNSWYGSSAQPASPANYPPSLLSLETTEPGGMYGQGRTPYDASSNYYQAPQSNSRSRNGSLTTYSNAEEISRASLKGKPSNRRNVGTELSSASENDSQYEAVTYWGERGSQQQQQAAHPQQQQKGSISKPEPTPMIRMLKRNDEKSAEYFAHHATVLPSQQMVGEEQEEEEDDEFNATIPLTQLSQGQSTTRNHNYGRSEGANDTGKQQAGVRGPQAASYSQHKRQQATEDTSGCRQTATVNCTQQYPHKKQNKQQHNGAGGKFNGAQGSSGSKPNASQPNSNNRQPAVTNHKENHPNKPASPSASKSAAVVAPGQPPVDNVWEKRMEEREKSVTTTCPQDKSNRQFDYHFPSMSDAARQEALAAAETPELFGSQQQIRHQDVRFEQQQSIRAEGQSGGRHDPTKNQWNPPTTAHNESHWNDDLSSNDNKEGNRRQQQQRKYRGNEHAGEQGGTPNTEHPRTFDPSDNIYEGNRREFVNSSKASRNINNGAGSTVQKQKPLRGATTTKQAGVSRNQAIRVDAPVPHTANQPVTSKQPRQQRGALTQHDDSSTATPEKMGTPLQIPAVKEPGLKPQPEEKDNFSNMDVFHAEDYHIEPAMVGSCPTANVDFAGECADGGAKAALTRRGNKRSAAQANTHYSNETSSGLARPSNRGGRSSNSSGVYVNKSWRSTDQPNKTRPFNNNKTEHPSVGDVPSEERQDLGVDYKGQGGGNRGNQKRGNTRLSTTTAQVHGARGEAPRFGQRNQNKATRHKTDNNAAKITSSSRHLGDRAGQLKSPVISDGGGNEEWETASESSDFAERTGRVEEESETNNQETHPSTNTRLELEVHKNNKKPAGNRNTNSGRRGQPKPVQGDKLTAREQQNSGNTTSKSQQTRSAGQKNVKPASHTYQGSSAKSSSSNNNKALPALYTYEQHSKNTKNARDGRKGSDVPKVETSNHYSARDGLAGVDINNASVIIIDHHPNHLLNSSVGGSLDELEAGDFEEVLSKKTKRQRLLQLEENRRKEQREKEKQEKIQEKNQAKRSKLQHRRKIEKGGSAQQTAASPDVQMETKPKEDCTSDPLPVSAVEPSALMLSTALFNTSSSCTASKSSNVSPTTAKPIGGLANGLAGSSLHDVTSNTTVWNSSHTLNTLDDFQPANGPVIPSPIARPIKVLNDSTRKSSTYSSSKSLTAVEKPELDFANYDPLKPTVGGSSQAGKGSSSSVSKSPIASGGEESGRNHQRQSSNDDHAQLQKKLDKVKNFWPGSASTDQPLNHHHHNRGQNNSPKEGVCSTEITGNVSTTISSSTSSSINAANRAQRQQTSTNSNHHNSRDGEIMPQFERGEQHPGNTRGKVVMESFPPTTINTPQSPITSTLFGNALFALGAPGGPTSSQLAPYSILMGSNGEQQWFAAPPPPPHQHHPANSPPNQQQHILNNIANQRSSRPNSFVEHGFHTATAPWSTNCGLEFLNGISATPPPMTGATPVIFQQQPTKNFSQQPLPALRMSSTAHPSGILAVSGAGVHPPGRCMQQGFSASTNIMRAPQLAHMPPRPANIQQMGGSSHFMPPPSPLDWSMPPPQFFPPPPNNRPQHMSNGFAALPPPQSAVPPMNAPPPFSFSAPPPPFPHKPLTMNGQGMAVTNGSAFGRNFVRPAAATQPIYYSSTNGAVELQKGQPVIINKQHNTLQPASPEANQRHIDFQDDSKKSPTNANCGAEIGNDSSADSNAGYGLFK